MNLEEMQDKIIKEIEWYVERGRFDSKDDIDRLVKNFFARGIFLGEIKGYKNAEKEFNDCGMYLEEED